MAYLPAVDPIGGKMIAWEIHCIISILRYRVPVARRPRMSDWGELASSLDALLLDHAPGLQEPLTYLFDGLSVRFQSYGAGQGFQLLDAPDGLLPRPLLGGGRGELRRPRARA